MNASAVILRLVLLAIGWAVLTEGSTAGWPLAAAVIGASALATTRLQPPGRWRWTAAGLLRFAPFFLWQSVAGGLDVARRALHPRVPLNPGLLEYPVRLPDGPARHFFTAAIGLLPGSLTAHVAAGRVTVHVLDRTLPVAATLRALEDRTADLYGLPPLT